MVPVFRIRVFSAKTLKPLAVLKYHREGLYCLGFANVELKLKDRIENDAEAMADNQDDQDKDISVPSLNQTSQDTGTNMPLHTTIDDDNYSQGSVVDSEESDDDNNLEDSLKSRAEWSRRHWLAAGGKENRISLWEIY